MFEFQMKKLSESNMLRKYKDAGPFYELDYDKVSDEILNIILDSKETMDAFSAYEKWESMNYEIDFKNEFGDSDYDSKLIGMVEDKLYEYKEQKETELMDRVFELEYNDYVRFEQGEFYVKSTNGNGSYRGCMIWAGPDKDDDRGWYFDVSDFIEVIEPSESGERLF